MSDNYDALAEQMVLAACLYSPIARAEARKSLVSEDFYDTRHETIWHAMSNLERNGKAVDAVTMLAMLGDDNASALMPELVTAGAIPENVGHYADIVRSWGIKRRLHRLALTVVQQSLKPDLNPVGYAATVATQFANLRDAGMPDTTTAVTLGELLAEPEQEADWLIPNLLERRDRFMLTGEEGLGKSHLLRQIAVMSAAGLDPFDATRIKPLRVTIIDVENNRSAIQRKLRPMTDHVVNRLGGLDPTERVIVDPRPRMDITRDKDLATIHQLLDATNPDMVVIGPLYRLSNRAIQTDDEAAPFLAALDTIRDRGIALLMEAHAGHSVGKGGQRDLRPRGSSALLGWPEFGYGLRAISESFCDVVPWRGDRDQRRWPERLRKETGGPRWLATEAFEYGASA